MSLSFKIFLLCLVCCASGCFGDATQISTLVVDGSKGSGRQIPDTFFGAFFEEINHAGAGGLWAELVRNRGFEAGGPSVPSNIYPWSIIGNDSTIHVSTDRTSCFERNKVALRMEVLCNGPKSCPPGGVGISNPGYWGMNIEKGHKYRVVFFVRALGPIDLDVSLVGSDNGVKLASKNIKAFELYVSTWRKIETILEAKDTNHNASLQITTSSRGVVWLDQVSAMPMDTYKGHGFRKDLFQMVADLKPKFFRFPGGCYVEGEYLRNAFRWKETVGPWEERPGHFDDVWKYWTDDGFGYFEGLQLSEDLGALPVWVFNAGLSLNDEVNTSAIAPFVQEALDGIEFARGSPKSTWGSLRAAMGHPKPFDLRIVAIGNENCGMFNYQGNYLKFYAAIKSAYPDMQIISNCDGSQNPLDHPADLYDFHIYTNAKDMFSKYTKFDNAPRSGPKAFVSEYAVWKKDAGDGSLLSAVAEAAFLIGLEKNSDVVHMVSYAPLFVNSNNRMWTPDAIVFDSYQHYGTPSYWLQHLFIESSGATFLNSTLETSSNSLVASAIEYTSSQDKKNYIRIKVVNFGSDTEKFRISINGLSSKVQQSGSTKIVLTSSNVMDENSFSQPNKIVPQRASLENASEDVNVELLPYSVTSFDLLTKSTFLKIIAQRYRWKSSERRQCIGEATTRMNAPEAVQYRC
ncbi:alpha-L-arabinofuranosidase 1-like [Abrus precatorius]|uniref:non-reducing end alpha-L-arabinofuranosidase n=1 Tax=Abrus precatorius TaxID=3816 RepID=A0A8B8L4I7_ABRPR|nr:alpha-L-arabinofuranosidase 1-like [Abrus precatorius]